MSRGLPPEAEEFLRRLRLALSGLGREQRDDVLAEIRSHFEERARAGENPALEQFGSPDEYAAQFIAESTLHSALAKGTPFALGHALLVAARGSLFALLVLLPLAALQLFAGCLVVLASIKPLWPDNVGLFFEPGGRFRAVGFVDPPGALHEVLGWWAIPVFLVSGALIFWASHRAMRAAVRGRLARTAVPRHER